MKHLLFAKLSSFFSFSCFYQSHPEGLLLCPDWARCSWREKGWEENWLEARAGVPWGLESWLPVATATKVQMKRLYGPNHFVVKEPVGPCYVKELRADGLLMWSFSLVSCGRRLRNWGQAEGGGLQRVVMVVEMVSFVPGANVRCSPYIYLVSFTRGNGSTS